MADEQPTNLSSNPTTDARRNKNEIAPQMLIENSPGARTIVSNEARESAECQGHRQTRLTRYRRAGFNRGSRRHRSWRVTTSGNTYRPNYNAPPERPDPPGFLREYGDNIYSESSERHIRDSERPSLDLYNGNRGPQMNYGTSYQYDYSHESIWGREPL